MLPTSVNPRFATYRHLGIPPAVLDRQVSATPPYSVHSPVTVLPTSFRHSEIVRMMAAISNGFPSQVQPVLSTNFSVSAFIKSPVTKIRRLSRAAPFRLREA